MKLCAAPYSPDEYVNKDQKQLKSDYCAKFSFNRFSRSRDIRIKTDENHEISVSKQMKMKVFKTASVDVDAVLTSTERLFHASRLTDC